jgi:hypothetical protein
VISLVAASESKGTGFNEFQFFGVHSDSFDLQRATLQLAIVILLMLPYCSLAGM